MRFFNVYLDKIYNYLRQHDGQTVLMKDIARDLNTTRVTVRKYVRWLERRELIKKTGKRFEIVDQFNHSD